ncbi:uncharacterized protein LOC132729164 [Ruditapes philippinarum]|uniref:uncharacterized protein LOC132729164 n=1 Tax=Ruditapes philippinarum TaxID=129788 RepID=UPI00295A9F20|nr:uncharacterized protein LOC132729164 [Ruditapes philippinarum]
MDTLLQMSDNLLLKLMTYERILDQRSRMDNELDSLYKQFNEANRNDLLLARIYTTTATCLLYNKLREEKWDEIQRLSDNITQTAVSIGYTDYFSLIERHNIPTQITPDADVVTQIWADSERLFTRRD